MEPSQRMPRGITILATVAFASLTIGCGKSNPLAERRADGSLSAGGGTAGGSGGAGDNDLDGSAGGGGARGGATTADARIGTGGAGGGATGTGGVIGGAPGSGGRSAGRTGTGGMILDGGAPGSGGKTSVGGAMGGKTGTGGVTAAGGSEATGGTSGSAGATGTECGGPSAITCPQGQFCDAASSCGRIADAAGVCVPINPGGTCPMTAQPVCGCENRTYSNDCQRLAAGMLKAADGVCPAGPVSYSTGYLVWQVPASPSETGPALVADAAAGRIDVWSDTAGFAPETPPSDPTTTYPLAQDDATSLWLRLVGVPLTEIPHGTIGSTGCNASLYFRHCQGCAGFTVRYSAPEQVTPQLDPLWSWFDSILGSTSAGNPREFCD